MLRIAGYFLQAPRSLFLFLSERSLAWSVWLTADSEKGKDNQRIQMKTPTPTSLSHTHISKTHGNISKPYFL